MKDQKRETSETGDDFVKAVVIRTYAQQLTRFAAMFFDDQLISSSLGSAFFRAGVRSVGVEKFKQILEEMIPTIDHLGEIMKREGEDEW